MNASDNALVEEWIAKAEGDWRSALRETRARLEPNYDSACFHSQQCVEKYLKAILQHENIAFPRTHSLGTLLNLLPEPRAEWEVLRADLETLSAGAVEMRYPGVSADRDDAKAALKTCRAARTKARTDLGLL